MAPDCALLPPLLCPIAGQVEATLRERNAADLELYAFARELVKSFERVRLRAFSRSLAPSLFPSPPAPSSHPPPSSLPSRYGALE